MAKVWNKGRGIDYGTPISEDNPPVVEEDDVFGVHDDDEYDAEADGFFSDDDNLDSIFSKLRNSLPGSDGSALRSWWANEKVKEAVYNYTIYATNFLYDGYIVMRLCRKLNAKHSSIPVLSFSESVAAARVIASISRSAIDMMNRNPSKTYTDFISEWNAKRG
jgi:hypothetical protein